MASPQRSILVVGAGPTGLAAALELARRGIRPRLIERGADFGPDNESRALAVNPRSLQLLEPSGVAQRIMDRSVGATQMRLHASGRRLATVEVGDASPWGGPRLLPQTLTEKLLAEALAGYGITPEWSLAFAGLEHGDGGIAVSLAHADGRIEQQCFDIVIGADGAHSAVRAALDVGFPGDSLEQPFWLADYTYARPVESDFVAAHLFDPGVIAHFPVDGHTRRYISTLPDYRDRIDHPAPIVSIPWESQFRVSFRHVDEMARDGVFLVGDAAHIHSPVGARGMNLGIEDACWLAWLISEGREDEYSALRMPQVRKVVAQTRRLTDLVLMRNPVLTTLRDWLLPLAVALPSVRRAALHTVAGLDTADPPWLAAGKPA